MTDRLLRVIENPNTSLMGHPTGRMLLRRDGSTYYYDKYRRRGQSRRSDGTDANPDRLDLRDTHLRWPKPRA